MWRPMIATAMRRGGHNRAAAVMRGGPSAVRLPFSSLLPSVAQWDGGGCAESGNRLCGCRCAAAFSTSSTSSSSGNALGNTAYDASALASAIAGLDSVAQAAAVSNTSPSQLLPAPPSSNAPSSSSSSPSTRSWPSSSSPLRYTPLAAPLSVRRLAFERSLQAAWLREALRGVRDQSFMRRPDADHHEAVRTLLRQIVSFVQLDPLSPAHRLTLADVSTLFHRCEEHRLAVAYARPLWKLVLLQQASARAEWAEARMSAPEDDPNAAVWRARPSILRVPYKLLGLILQNLAASSPAFSSTHRKGTAAVSSLLASSPLSSSSPSSSASSLQSPPPPPLAPPLAAHYSNPPTPFSGPNFAARELFSRVWPCAVLAPQSDSANSAAAAPAAAEPSNADYDVPPPQLPPSRWQPVAAASTSSDATHPFLYYPARPQSEAELEAAASDARLDPQDPGFRCFEVHAGVFTPLLQRFVIAASNASASASSAVASATSSPANAVQEFFDAIPVSLRNEVTYSILLGSFSARGAIDQAVALLAPLEQAVQQGYARLDEAAALALLRRLERQSKEAPDMVAAARTLLPLTQAIWALLLRQSAITAKNSDSFSTSAAASDGALTPTVTAAMLRAMSLAGLDQASRLVTVLRGACAAEGEEGVQHNGSSATEQQQQQIVPALYADAECFLFVLAQLRRASAALETNADGAAAVSADANTAAASGGGNGGGSLRHQAALVEQMARDRHAAAASLVQSLINSSIAEGRRASRVVAAASNRERALRLPAHLDEAVARFAPMTPTTVESPSRYSLSLPSATTTAVSASAPTPAAAAAASLPSLSPEEALLVRRDPWRLNASRVAAGLADPSSPVSRLLDSLRRMRERGHPFTIERVHEATQGFTDEHLSVPALEELLRYYALIPPTAPPASSKEDDADAAAATTTAGKAPPPSRASKSSSAKTSFLVDESVHAALPQAAFNRVVKGQALVPRSSTYAALIAALVRHWQPRQLGSILRARKAMLQYKPPPPIGAASRAKHAKKTTAAAADTNAADNDAQGENAAAAATMATETAPVGLRFTAEDFRVMRPAMHARKETAKLLRQWQEEDSPPSVLPNALEHPALSSLSAEKRLQPGYLAEQYYAHLVRGRGDDAQAVLRAAEAVVPVVTLPVLYNWMRNLLRVAPKLAALQQQRTPFQQAQQEQSELMPSTVATPPTTDGGGVSRIPSAWEEVQRLWGLMQRAQLTPNSNLARVTFEVGMVSDRTWRAQAAWGALHDDMLAGRGAFGHAQPLIMEPEHYAALIRRAQHMNFPAAVRAWTARAKEADKRRKQLQQLKDKFVLLPDPSASSHADDTGAARMSILTPSDSSLAKTASVRAGESTCEVDIEGVDEGDGGSMSLAAAPTTSASAAASGKSQLLRADAALRTAPHGHPAEPAGIAHATRIKAADEAAAATAAKEMGEGTIR